MSRTTISEFQFLKQFDTEAKAVRYFESLRWPDGRTCPHCNGAETYPHKSKAFYYRCPDCRKDFTCKVNTIMQASPLPVRMWLYTMYKISVARKGIASLQLAKEIGVTQKSAWHMLHRIKEACGGDAGLLAGIVEIDETFVGGKPKNRPAKQRRQSKGKVGWHEEKQAVIGMRERGGRTIAKPIDGTDRATLHTAIRGTVAQGATIYTDHYTGYAKLNSLGYVHESVNHSANEYVRGLAHTNGIETVWAVLKRSLMGTYHHVSMKHLHRYVNEATFRLNEGHVRHLLMSRIAALCRLSVGTRLPYHVLTRGV